MTETFLQSARLVPGSESPTEEGVSKPIRCTIILKDGARRAAILKRGPIDQIAAEAFCAVLLREWGLPVPDPFLIIEEDQIAFASADAGYPSLCQRLGIFDLPEGPARNAAAKIAQGIAIKLKTTPLATAIDEAIDNRDRNLGNILWDGENEAWIDHALALGNGDDQCDRNLLCTMATNLETYEVLQTGAIGQALALDRGTPTDVGSQFHDTLRGQKYADFISLRLNSLAIRLLARFPQPRDLLSET